MSAGLVLCPLLLTFGAEKEKAPKLQLKSASAKLSYALGMDIGASLKRLEAEIDPAIFFRGVEDTLKGGKPLLTPQEATEIRNEFFTKKREELAQRMKETGEKNLKEGEAFLAENKKKDGVVTTASGLQYMVLRKGDGSKPKKTDQVTVNYQGTLIDGTEFDSSYKRGQPATFSAGGVIPGWTEALQLMNVGSKYRLFIPSNLAYGERGSGARIGPNAALIFEVELLGIEK
ncbi:FKBP-type peptidyl-prolyl cis-trans isomerase [bacterium]|nr:FKBP-type peptidyl-prolyl cis-trans isomerase [bacterium]